MAFWEIYPRSPLGTKPTVSKEAAVVLCTLQREGQHPIELVIDDKLKDAIERLPKSGGILHVSSLLDKTRITSDEIILIPHASIALDIQLLLRSSDLRFCNK